MRNRSDASELRRQQLSSLMDGELSAGEAADACALWRQDADTRADWHAWHLIGDVLRSDDLAVRPARDEAFLQALRLRLADEPVPLAPSAAPAVGLASSLQVANGAVVQGAVVQGAVGGAAVRRGRPRSWMMAPVAVAAGFVAVLGVTLVTRTSTPEASAVVQARAEPTAGAASAVLVRNAQLDRYLSAHRGLASGAMAGAGAEQRMHIVFEGR